MRSIDSEREPERLDPGALQGEGALLAVTLGEDPVIQVTKKSDYVVERIFANPCKFHPASADHCLGLAGPHEELSDC